VYSDSTEALVVLLLLLVDGVGVSLNSSFDVSGVLLEEGVKITDWVSASHDVV